MTCRAEHEWSDYYRRGETLTDVTQCDCKKTTWGQYVEVGALRGVLAAVYDEVVTLRGRLSYTLRAYDRVDQQLIDERSDWGFKEADYQRQIRFLIERLRATGQTL